MNVWIIWKAVIMIEAQRLLDEYVELVTDFAERCTLKRWRAIEVPWDHLTRRLQWSLEMKRQYIFFSHKVNDDSHARSKASVRRRIQILHVQRSHLLC